MIQLHRLEGFFWVAKTGGYARAARAFPYPITQPAVHQQVKKLEQELDVTLFERVGKDQMIPTPAGRRLFEFVEPFFAGLPPVLRAIRAGEESGELVVEAESMMLRHLLPDWLKRLQREHPGIQVDLREVPTGDVTSLRQGHADLLVAWIPEPPPDIATIEVARMLPFAVLPGDHPKARAKRFVWNDLRDDTFIAYHKHLDAHALQVRALELHGIEPPHMLFAGSAENIVGFVQSGLGWSLVPSLFADGPQSPGIHVRPLPRFKTQFPVVAAWRKDTPENRMLDAALATAPKLD